MTPHDGDLERLQRWMQTVISHPDGITVGIASSSAQQHIDVTADDVEDVICRSRALGSIERLAVYGNAYYARLIECLAAEFPTVREAVGEEAFSGFVFGYLQDYPSTSYTLSDLGAGFPAYLADTRPSRAGDQPDWADFLVDVATLERLYSDVFDGPGEEQLTLIDAEELKSISPGRWGEVRLETVPSLRLVELRFPVQEYVTAVRQGETATFPEPRPTRLAVNRREFVVRRRMLERLPFDLLKRLQDDEPLGEAIEGAVAAVDVDTSDLSDRLRKWFREWTAAGYFVAVKDSSPGCAPRGRAPRRQSVTK